MSIKVHHLNFSRSLRTLWLLEELELDYAIQSWERDENFRAPAAAADVHPLGRFPMVEVDGRMLVESGAVLEYFANREGKLRPSDEDEALECTMFMHYAEGSLMPPLLVSLIFARLRAAPMPFFVKPIARGIADKAALSRASGERPNMLAWRDRVAGRSAYQRAQAKGGKAVPER